MEHPITSRSQWKDIFVYNGKGYYYVRKMRFVVDLRTGHSRLHCHLRKIGVANDYIGKAYVQGRT